MTFPNDAKEQPCLETGECSTSRSPPIERFERVVDHNDWTGPDDPDNPHNWPKWKRVMHSAIPAVYAFGLYVPHVVCSFISPGVFTDAS